MQKNSISPSVFHEFFNSTTTRQRGQAQYFTPTSLANNLALALPAARSCLADFHCGNGQLLRGASIAATKRLLGADIGAEKEFLKADFTQFAGLLDQAGFRADLLVLNPPWSLAWERERFAFLEKSELPAVRAAFASGAGALDSTFATLCAALHFLTEDGEGLLLANHPTAERLLLNSPLAAHVWAHLVIDGDSFGTGHAGETSVLYFARQSRAGSMFTWRGPVEQASAGALAAAAERPRHHLGLNLRFAYQFSTDTAPAWDAAAEEYRRQHSAIRASRPDFNLWLGHDGSIQTYVSLFDQRARPELLAQAEALHSLQGRAPHALILQRATRDILLRQASLAEGDPSPWRVEPRLQQAVRAALADYHRSRAPLYPLPPIKRLGYLEEEDSIQCLIDLHDPEEPDSPAIFRAGQSYPLATRSVPFTRTEQRVNWDGEAQDIEYTGQDLATILTGGDGREWNFLDARLRHPGIHIPHHPGSKPSSRRGSSNDSLPIHFTLQDLAAHFLIPEVPDVSVTRPEEYAAHLRTLAAIEAMLSAAA